MEYPLLLVFPAVMLYGGAMDVLTMTIPNRASVALVVGFVAAALLGGMSWPQFFTHIGVGFAVLVISIMMFARGWIGGGDAKLWAAAALWFGYDHVLQYTLLVAMIGGVLAMLILTYRKLVPPMWISGREWAERLHDKKVGIPYGVALAAAALWLYPKTPLYQAMIG